MAMLIRMRCPKCENKFDIPHEYAGKRIRCKRCEEVVRVPVPASLQSFVDGSLEDKTSDALPPEEETTQEEEAQEGALIGHANRGFQLKWVITGPLVLNGVLFLALLAFYLLQLNEAKTFAAVVDNLTSSKLNMLILPAGCFLIGAAVIGWQSSGWTIFEPAISVIVTIGIFAGAAIGAVGQQGLLANMESYGLTQTDLGIGVGVCFLTGIIGAFIGEIFGE